MTQAIGEIRSVAARRGTQREYETVLILRPNTNKAGVLELVSRMQKIFARHGARLLQIENWGLRTLSYTIKRSKTGIYLYWRFIGGSDIVGEFERNLRLAEAVLRYYTVRVNENVDPGARPSEITEDLLDAVSEPPPEPEEEEEVAEEVAAPAAPAEATANAAAAAAPTEGEPAKGSESHG